MNQAVHNDGISTIVLVRSIAEFLITYLVSL